MELQSKFDIRYFVNVFLLSAILFCSNLAYGQNIYRRHFIITCDASIGYDRTGVSNVLEQLFQGNRRVVLCEGSTIFQKEIEDGKIFFDPLTDEISFFYFNLSDNDFVSLRGETDGAQLVKKIPELYFKKKSNWSNYRSLIPDIKSYIIARLTDTRVPANYTIPNFVYPLVLNKIDITYYPEEYILIILARDPPETFTIADQHTLASHINSSVDGLFEKQLATLSVQFNKTNYFNCTGLHSYFITPKNVQPASVASIVNINSDIQFSQGSYNGNDFITSPIQINFPVGTSMVPSEVELAVNIVGKGGNNTIFKDVVASGTNEGKISSSFSSGGLGLAGKFSNFFNSNQSGSTFTIPSLKLYLPELNSDRIHKDLRLNFVIKTKVKTTAEQALNFVFYTNTLVPNENVNYKGQEESIIMILILLLFILGAYIYFRKGRPIGIKLKLHPFTDTYENTDFSEHGKGRWKTPYRAWTEEDEKRGRLSIKVFGRLSYTSTDKFFNWNESRGYPLQIRPLFEIQTEGFHGFIESNGLQAGVNDPIELKDEYGFDAREKKYKDFEFKIVLCKQDKYIIDKPIFVNFSVEVSAKVDHLLYKSAVLKCQLPYEFHLGPQLGNVWVGIDPGTTGSCIATATSIEDITIEQFRGNDKISPSVINIDVASITSPNYSFETLKAASEFGARADARKETETRKKFVSLKKLLGYRDSFILKEYQGEKISVTSTQLSSLLIEGVLDEHKEYIEGNINKLHFKAFCSYDDTFSPKRLAIAIPNNFTSTKIQHLKESIEGIPAYKFDEIRFIYEAEAILMHYINGINANSIAQESEEGEIVFVFDMGGATINATLARIERRLKEGNVIFNFEILGKLGYGIGGDTIDYAFTKWLYSFKSHYNELNNLNPFGTDEKAMTLRKRIKDAMLGVKSEMIKNHNSKALQLYSRSSLQNFAGLNLKTIVDVDGNVDEKDPFMRFLNKKGDNIITSEIFQTLIWDNISKIVDDILALCVKTNVTNLHTLILSGRSTIFPMVKETVMKTIENKSSFHPKIIDYDLFKAKSAVALGACYYGIQKESIHLRNISTSGVFGVKQNIDPQNFVFHKLIDVGSEFLQGENGIDKQITKQAVISQEKSFSYDGLRVNFYQIMGSDAFEILRKNERHKFSRIASMPVHVPIERINVSVSEKDRVKCSVIDDNNDMYQGNAIVRDAEITDYNDEHYTFFIK